MITFCIGADYGNQNEKTCFTVGHVMNKYAVGAVSAISIDISLGFGASFNSNSADKALSLQT
jgi:hypothetical protein